MKPGALKPVMGLSKVLYGQIWGPKFNLPLNLVLGRQREGAPWSLVPVNLVSASSHCMLASVLHIHAPTYKHTHTHVNTYICTDTDTILLNKRGQKVYLLTLSPAHTLLISHGHHSCWAQMWLASSTSYPDSHKQSTRVSMHEKHHALWLWIQD